MADDLIRYDLHVQEALKGVVRKVMSRVQREGLPGEHHFYISFKTTAAGVRLSGRMREKYPDEMTIVLQHQFWDLGVTDHGFEVGLSFGGVPERLLIPFDAVTGFFDPSVEFGLKFEPAPARADGDASPAVDPVAGSKLAEFKPSVVKPGASGPFDTARPDASRGDAVKSGDKPGTLPGSLPATLKPQVARPALPAPAPVAALPTKRGPKGAGTEPPMADPAGERPVAPLKAPLGKSRKPAKTSSDDPPPDEADSVRDDDSATATKVVSLDAFRKKP